MMDSTIKSMLDGYGFAMQSYKEKLGADNEVFKKAESMFAELTSIAEAAADLNDFYAKGMDKFQGMSTALMDLAKEKPVNPAKIAIPTSAQIAQPYHIAYDAITDIDKSPETKKVYERVFEIEKTAENGLQFMRIMAGENLLFRMSLVPAIEKEKSGLRAGAENTSQPQMLAYHDYYLKDLESCKSPTEMEYLSNVRADVSYFDTYWENGLVYAVYWTLIGAINAYIISPSEDKRQGVENAYRFLASYFSLDYDRMISLPRIRDYFDKVVWISIKEDWAKKGVNSEEEYFNIDRSVLDVCMKDRPPLEFGSEENHKVVYRGSQYLLQELPGNYKNIPHPDRGKWFKVQNSRFRI